MGVRPEINEYQDEITFVTEFIIKVRYSKAFPEKDKPAAELTAAYAAAYLLGYAPQREATNDLVQSAFIEIDFIEKDK